MILVLIAKSLESQNFVLVLKNGSITQKQIKELETQLPGIKIILVDGEMFSWYRCRLLKAYDYLRNLMPSLLV